MRGRKAPSIAVKEILDRLRASGSEANVQGMARYGIRPASAFGVPAPVIRSLAREIGRNQEIASALWDTGVHEARILACLIADPDAISEQLVERWVREFDSWAVCDSACLAFVWRTPFAWQKVREWSGRQAEYERRAAFALIAALTVHDKAAPERNFLPLLKIIEKAAHDERNLVKKAVNWALRQIGKRSLALHKAALDTAERLATSDSRSARWIATDALRELRSPAVLERLRARSARVSVSRKRPET
jgi:3-methyladenine DNA glycosylase AlkD